MWDKIIVGVVVLTAAVFVARGLLGRLSGRGGCEGCPSKDCPFRKNPRF
jgi:hypothetical protein